MKRILDSVHGYIEIDNVYVENIVDTEFDSNLAFGDGGAIHAGGELSVTKSTFKGNTANRDGGAILNYKGDLSFKESSFKFNLAKRNGGAINNFDCEMTISQSRIADNSAENGGAVYNDRSALDISESILSENTADIHGGAIWINKLKDYESDNSTMKDNEPDDIYEGSD